METLWEKTTKVRDWRTWLDQTQTDLDKNKSTHITKDLSRTHLHGQGGMGGALLVIYLFLRGTMLKRCRVEQGPSFLLSPSIPPHGPSSVLSSNRKWKKDGRVRACTASMHATFFNVVFLLFLCGRMGSDKEVRACVQV